MIKRLSSISRWIVCGAVLSLGAIQANAQATGSTPPAAAPAPAPAPAPAAPAPPTVASLNTSVTTLQQQVADLAAYVTNGASGAQAASATEGLGDSVLKSFVTTPVDPKTKEPFYPNVVPGPGHNA